MSDELYGQPAVANRDLIDQWQMLCISDLASASGEAPQVRHRWVLDGLAILLVCGALFIGVAIAITIHGWL
jgi:hypothetical protein